MSDALRLSFTEAEATRNRALYRRVLAIVLWVETAVGVLAVVAPSPLLGFLSTSETASPLLRLWGAGLIVAVALYAPGYFDPLAARWPNFVGVFARAGAAALCCCLGGGMLRLALLEFAAAAALGWSYWRFLRAELMTRP